jgi:Uma2 family endonuclease
MHRRTVAGTWSANNRAHHGRGEKNSAAPIRYDGAHPVYCVRFLSAKVHDTLLMTGAKGATREMVTMVTTKQVTAAELEAAGSEFDRFELVRGELREVAAAGARHGKIANDLGAELRSAVKLQGIGVVFGAETGFVVAREPDTVLVPDVSFVSRARLTQIVNRDSYVPFAPDLAVEIESPTNRSGEMMEKIGLYFDGGSRLVWLVRPRHQTVTVFRPSEPEVVLRDGDTLDGGDLIPGFSLPLTELFSDDL